MGKTIKVLQDEFASLRAGRANPHCLDRILVDYYGTPTPIQQLGNLSTPEPRILQISIWDTKAIKEVEKAIQKSDLGINPTNDGKHIRLVFPALTQERRNANDQLKKLEKASEITEDDLKKFNDDVQKMTDDFIKEIDSLAATKEKEIMEV